jgi:sigma-B regulation protein RsbU (phosphoserine phosphatase)
VKPARILVVDDQPAMLRAVGRVLGERHQVFQTTSSLEAVAIAARVEPDIAILDIRMPEMDGFELLARLKQDHPAIDVILMTGSATEPDQKLIRAIREKAFYFIQKPFDREVLNTLIDRCLDLRRLEDDNRAYLGRLQSELDEARALQQGLLPAEHALLGEVEIDCRYVPCSEVGGDFCDFADAGRGRVALLVADVSGHGASAAMLTGIVKSSFHAAHAEGYDPLAVATRAFHALRTFPPNRYVTIGCAVVDPREDCIEYVNAGHPPPYFWSGKGTPVPMKPTGPIISPVFDTPRWTRARVAFPRGSCLLLCTDGVTEAPAGEGMFGEERLLSEIRTHAEGGGPLLDALLDAVRNFSAGRPQPDDLTLLTARRV